MTTYRPGDAVLVSFPFADQRQRKKRPAVVVADTGDNDLVVPRVTTQRYTTAFNLPIADWQEAGLLAPSTVRLHKLATIEKSLIGLRLGSLSANDRERASSILRGKLALRPGLETVALFPVNR